MPDTGASQSILSAATARDANLTISPTSTDASGNVMNLLGEAKVVLCNDKHSTQTTVLVAADLNHAALIGGKIYNGCMSSLLLFQLWQLSLSVL